MGIVKNLILGVSIAIIFAFFIGFGISAFYEGPERSDFCDEEKTFRAYQTEEDCIAQGGKWESYSERSMLEKPVPAIRDDQLICTRTYTSDEDEYILHCRSQESPDNHAGFCDIDFYCHKEYEDGNETYNRDVFIIAAIIGLITMLIGGFILKHESVSPGVMGGGLITIIYGVIRYWEYAGDKLRVIILGIILAMLIYFAYKRLSFGSKKNLQSKEIN
ncbi:MAG: hypothetical protein U9R34_06425 [Nanoarchaeota archaeon]|nr:hypothetical protein [Nanoarchaeota archaeon]